MFNIGTLRDIFKPRSLFYFFACAMQWAIRCEQKKYYIFVNNSSCNTYPEQRSIPACMKTCLQLTCIAFVAFIVTFNFTEPGPKHGKGQRQ